jgi:hypothetical protein
LVEELRQYDPDPVKEWKLARDEEALPEQVAERNINEEEQENQVATVREGDYGYLFDMPTCSFTN